MIYAIVFYYKLYIFHGAKLCLDGNKLTLTADPDFCQKKNEICQQESSFSFLFWMQASKQ